MAPSSVHWAITAESALHYTLCCYRRERGLSEGRRDGAARVSGSSAVMHCAASAWCGLGLRYLWTSPRGVTPLPNDPAIHWETCLLRCARHRPRGPARVLPVGHPVTSARRMRPRAPPTTRSREVCSWVWKHISGVQPTIASCLSESDHCFWCVLPLRPFARTFA
jgi:hypothetical protein